MRKEGHYLPFIVQDAHPPYLFSKKKSPPVTGDFVIFLLLKITSSLQFSS